MNPYDLLQALRAAGVTLRIVGDSLRYRAPRGALTPELRAALAEHKPDILHDYHERAGIVEYHGGLPRAEAEALAAVDVLGDLAGQRGQICPAGRVLCHESRQEPTSRDILQNCIGPRRRPHREGR